MDDTLIPIVKIKSTHPASQGEFVLIEAADFDPAKGHELHEPEAKARPAKTKTKD